MKKKLSMLATSVLVSVILPLSMVSSVLAVSPEAVDDSVTTSEDTAVNINVLANDTDPDNDTLTVVSVTTPANGAAVIESDGTVTYTPNANFNGNDSFDYSISDGNEGSDTGTVTVTINAVNDPPVADAGGPYSADEGSPVIFDASASSDIDSQDLEYRWDFSDNGTWTQWSINPSASYTWYDDWSGTARVDVSDGQLSDNATTSVMINNVAPTIDAVSNQTIFSGESGSVNATFTDPGTLDTHHANIDWGDGNSSDGTVNEVGGSGNVTGGHQYFIPGTYTVEVTVTDDDGGESKVSFDVEVVPVTINIDIKPGSDRNPINLGSMGRTPVAILTTEDFDATTVSPSTVRFGPGQAEPLHHAMEDVDDDGDIDMILHFSTQDLGLVHEDTEATLSGQTIGGVYFVGTDSVSIVPEKIKPDPDDKGKDGAPGQSKEPGSPAEGKGKDAAPGQNKDPGTAADGKETGKDNAPGQNNNGSPPGGGSSNAPGQSNNHGSPPAGGSGNAPGQSNNNGSPPGGGSSNAPGQNKSSGPPATGNGKNK